jgi:hypothetical protein
MFPRFFATLFSIIFLSFDSPSDDSFTFGEIKVKCGCEHDNASWTVKKVRLNSAMKNFDSTKPLIVSSILRLN